jgi:hypothetical protein
MDYVPFRRFWAVYDGGGTDEKPGRQIPSAGGKVSMRDFVGTVASSANVAKKEKNRQLSLIASFTIFKMRV